VFVRIAGQIATADREFSWQSSHTLTRPRQAGIAALRQYDLDLAQLPQVRRSGQESSVEVDGLFC